jgi:hypothetical protein
VLLASRAPLAVLSAWVSQRSVAACLTMLKTPILFFFFSTGPVKYSVAVVKNVCGGESYTHVINVLLVTNKKKIKKKRKKEKEKATA